MKITNRIIEQSTGQFEIKYGVLDSHANLTMNFEFAHTRHSFLRADQRGMSKEFISAVLQFGESYFKQGLIYYILGDRMDTFLRLPQRYRNAVIVVAGDSNQIITCYRSNNPFKHIKHKSKQINNQGISTTNN